MKAVFSPVRNRVTAKKLYNVMDPVVLNSFLIYQSGDIE
jgi:hypothetical protein